MAVTDSLFRDGGTENAVGPDGAFHARDPRWMRLLDWIEARTSGVGSWPWGQIWLGRGPLRGFAFHFATGYPSGFALTFPLPRMLPGFVRPYQVPITSRTERRDTDLHALIPLFPPGLPSAMRTRRLRGHSDQRRKHG